MRGGKSQLGISVSDRSIEVVEVADGKGLVLTAASRVELEAGVVERGAVVDEQRFVAALKQALQAASPKPFSTKRAVLAMPDAVSFLYVFRFPPTVTREELKTAIRFQAEEVIPLSLAETVADFMVTAHDQAAHIDVVYAAVDRAVLQTYIQALKLAELELAAIGTEAFALWQVAPSVADPQSAILIADLGAKQSALIVVDQIGIRSSFTRYTAGEAMTQALADKLGVDAAKAEAQKIKHGLKGDKKVAAALKPFAERIGLDLGETIDFHEREHDSQVKQILFVGGGSLLPGLLPFLTAAVSEKHPGLTIDRLNASKLVEASGAVTKTADQILFLPAIGAALHGRRPGIRPLNFLQPQVAATNNRSGKLSPRLLASGLKPWPLIAAAVFILLALGALAAAFYWRGGQSAKMEAGLEERLGIADGEEVTVRLPARQVVLSGLTASQTITPAQTVEVESVAEGMVTLINESEIDQPLVARTRLLDQNGILFRLRQSTVVPANGALEAAVYADQPGGSGDIGPTDFTIPGLPPSRQQEVYARSDEPMTGGVKHVGTLAPTDVDASGEFLLAAAKESLASTIASVLIEDEMFISDLAIVTATSIVAEPAIGTEVESAIVTLTYGVDIFLIRRSDLPGPTSSIISASRIDGSTTEVEIIVARAVD